VHTRIGIARIGPKTTIVMTTVVMGITLVLVIGGLPASSMNVQATNHSECFNAGQSDRADHPFDASRFDRCGKNYQDGFLKGCMDAGHSEETCQSAEDNQD
jgi:hypothetical protein